MRAAITASTRFTSLQASLRARPWPSRTLTVTWRDPTGAGRQARPRRAAGSTSCAAIISRRAAHTAPIQELLGFSLDEAEEGRVVFSLEPGRTALQPDRQRPRRRGRHAARQRHGRRRPLRRLPQGVRLRHARGEVQPRARDHRARPGGWSAEGKVIHAGEHRRHRRGSLRPRRRRQAARPRHLHLPDPVDRAHPAEPGFGLGLDQPAPDRVAHQLDAVAHAELGAARWRGATRRSSRQTLSASAICLLVWASAISLTTSQLARGERSSRPGAAALAATRRIERALRVARAGSAAVGDRADGVRSGRCRPRAWARSPRRPPSAPRRSSARRRASRASAPRVRARARGSGARPAGRSCAASTRRARATSGRSASAGSTASMPSSASADDLHVGLAVDQHRQAGAHDAVVVGDQDADHPAPSA